MYDTPSTLAPFCCWPAIRWPGATGRSRCYSDWWPGCTSTRKRKRKRDGYWSGIRRTEATCDTCRAGSYDREGDPQPLLLTSSLLDLCGESRQDLEQVADNAVVGNLEDRSVLVLVDGDNGLGGSHSGKVLDRSRNSNGDIQIRADQPPGLADLIGWRTPAIIGHGASGTHRGITDCRRQLLNQLEILRCPEPAAAAHDHRGLAEIQLRSTPLGELGDGDARLVRVARG